MSGHTCSQCARDTDDCSCNDCTCHACLVNNCCASVRTQNKEVSEAELDSVVARASTPSLATLYKQGKKSGLITPTPTYGNL